ncbi:MAG: glycosyltransferase family 2 protein [Candidatus Acidiferrales bacterium]
MDLERRTATSATPRPEANPAEAIEVSVVIPCLNEANSLGFCIDKARKSFETSGIRGEVVVADNGSTDGSLEVAEQCGARVIRVSARGYGNALRAGIAAARGRFIIMGDADDSYDFSAVPQFVAKWREGYDVVMGNRFRGGIEPGAMPWSHKYIGNPGLTAVMNLFFKTGIGDCLCGLRGFTREIHDRIDVRTSGMEWGPEFVIKAAKAGARMTEIPIVLWPDKRGRRPHLKTISDGWRNLRFMLLFSPNWLFLLPGSILMALGLAIVFWLLPGQRHLTSRIILDIHTMIFGVIFTLLGAQIICIGFFAKVFSYAERFDRNPISLKRMLSRVKLEHGLLLGAVLALVGFAGDAWVFVEWARSDFGPLNQVRWVLFWSLWFFLGVQLIFSSFFLSMLGISRDTYIGDYELKHDE